jgi:ATP-binding protein involved in chromosome partitioning
MFYQVKVPVLGLVENMSYLMNPANGQKIDVFGSGGGKRTADEMGIRFLGEIPLDPAIRMGGDSGKPVALQNDLFRDIADQVAALAAESAQATGPTISISD